jgi:hypothetical protein
VTPRQTLAQLNEGALSEPAGIGGPSGRNTILGSGGASHWYWANTPIDWNWDTDTTDVGISEDINRLDFVGGCAWLNPAQNLPDWSVPVGDLDCGRFANTVARRTIARSRHLLGRWRVSSAR